LKSELSKTGIDLNYLDAAIKLTDVNKIIVNEDGTVLGADELVKDLVKKVPVFFQKPSVGASHQPPVGVAKSITLEEWKKLSPKDQEENYSKLWESLGVTRRK
jgi:hypothetical protein